MKYSLCYEFSKVGTFSGSTGIGNKETIKKILIVRIKDKQGINKKEMFFSTLRPFKLILSPECD